MNAKKFTNTTTEDFTYTFDSIPYTFKVGQSIYLEDYKADHFAKHLADREMNRRGVPTSSVGVRNELTAAFFADANDISTVEAVDLNAKAEKKSKKKVEVEEFPDLKNKK